MSKEFVMELWRSCNNAFIGEYLISFLNQMDFSLYGELVTLVALIPRKWVLRDSSEVVGKLEIDELTKNGYNEIEFS